MPRRILDRIRMALRNAAYDMTVHAVEELAEDKLDFIDVETAILNGRLIKTEKGDPRGTRYIVHGTGELGQMEPRLWVRLAALLRLAPISSLRSTK